MRLALANFKGRSMIKQTPHKTDSMSADLVIGQYLKLKAITRSAKSWEINFHSLNFELSCIIFIK